MKRRKYIVLLLAALVAVAGLTVVAVAAAKSGSLPGREQEAPVSAPAGAINSDQAAQAAQDATGQAATTVELDDENGTTVYEVQAGGNEVAVDAVTGQVLKAENGDDDGSSEGGDDQQSAHEADDDAQGADNASSGQQETED